MTQPIPEAIQAERLTATLRRAGVLGAAHVSGVTVESSRDTILSRIIRIRLMYSVSADDAPRSLIFKTCHPDRVGDALHAGRQEVAFYDQIAPLMATNIVPRCFEAYRDAETNAWHLVLEDLTETHAVATQWPLPPTRPQCGAIVRAHARLHASWWDSPRLGVSVGTWLDPEAMDRQMQLVASDFQRFADRAGDVASRDLAYMIAMHWYPDRRQAMERSLLDEYHETLIAHGVQGYDRHMLEADYRLSVLWQMTTPVWQAVNNIPAVIWWNGLERIMLAVDDLDCRSLLA
jgi:hypothetical protein